MKILFATYWYMPHVGGVNTYIYLLKKELEQHGHQVDILAHHPDMQQIYLQSNDTLLNGKTVIKSKLKDILYSEVYDYYQRSLPHVDPWIRWREIERYTFELAASLFNLHQYDLIHTQDIVSTRALRRVKPVNVPLVYTLQGLLANVHLFTGDIASKQSLKWKYVWAEEHFGTISADQIISTSNWLRQELIQNFGVPDENLKVIIPYGMDAAAFLEKMKIEPEPPVPMNSNQFVIACPARLSVEKGHTTLIEALSILKEQRNDFICWIIGDGSLRRDLEKYSEEKGVADHVLFMGNRSDVPALLNKADVMVMPSIEDNLPHAIMEAQISGKAIVASTGGGIPEMIEHGITGLIFDKTSSSEMAHWLDQVLKDPQLRHQLGVNAKAFGEKNWSSKVLAGRTLEVYKREAISMNSSEQHGLILSPSSIFSFDANTKLFTKEWKAVVNYLPDSYSIPDKIFIKVLTSSLLPFH